MTEAKILTDLQCPILMRIIFFKCFSEVVAHHLHVSLCWSEVTLVGEEEGISEYLASNRVFQWS